MILLGLTGSLILGGATKLRCANGEWADGRQYRLLCYSDIVPLLTTERLQTGRLPYFEPCGNGIPGSTCDEYPC